MAVVDSAEQWEPCSWLSKSEYLQLASSGVADKVASENPIFQATDPAVVERADRLLQELQDKGWLELSGEFYDLGTTHSKGSVDWKVPPATGSQGSAGGEPPGPSGGGGGGGSGKGTGQGAASGGSVGTHDQGRTVESGGRVGLLNVADKTTVEASKSAKFADIRTSQNVEPPPLDVVKSVGVRAASTTHWSALPSTTAFSTFVGTGRGSSSSVPITGVKYKSVAIRTKPHEVHDGEPVLRSATGAEVSEMGAETKSAGIHLSVSSGATSGDFPMRQGTASAVGDGQPAEFNARLDSGALSVLCNLNSAGIRTCWGTDLQSEIGGRAEDETCAGAEDLSTGVDAGPVGGADMRERDGYKWRTAKKNLNGKKVGKKRKGRTNGRRVEKMFAAVNRLTRSDTCTRCNAEVTSTTKRRRWKWRLRWALAFPQTRMPLTCTRWRRQCISGTYAKRSPWQLAGRKRLIEWTSTTSLIANSTNNRPYQLRPGLQKPSGASTPIIPWAPTWRPHRPALRHSQTPSLAQRAAGLAVASI